MKNKHKGNRELATWSPHGEMTIYTASDNKLQLVAALETGKVLEIDLAQVTEIDTAGLQLLILAKQELRRRDQALRITGHSAAVVEVLDLCDMTGFFGDPVVMPSRNH
jgi:anti-sigma B factor antagonist